jgi:hypothetical protein
MRILFVLLLVAASAQGALAAKDPCDRYTDADAYNNCLAGFGPAAGRKTYSKATAHERAAPRTRRRALAKNHADDPAGQSLLVKPAREGRVRLELMIPAGQ